MRLSLLAALRSATLIGLAVSVVGCGSIDSLYREAERAGNRAYNDRYGDRSSTSRDVRRGAERYVDRVDRAVRLDRRQERRVYDLLEDRAVRYASRGRYDRDRSGASPFPRRARQSRDADRFWRDADRRIERVLDRRQRDRYRRFTRQFDDRRYHDDRRDREDRRSRDRDDDDDWDDDDD